MVSVFISVWFLIKYLNKTLLKHQILGGLVLRVKDCRSGTPGSSRPWRDSTFFCRCFFFSFKIEETCTLTTFVEQKLSICVNKRRNFM